MAVVQRFGAALNLNVHVHALVLDGVFAQDGDDSVTFRPLPPPSDDDVTAVLATVRHRVLRLLQRRGLLDAPDGFVAVDSPAEESPVLAGISAASVVGSVALGPRASWRAPSPVPSALPASPASRPVTDVTGQRLTSRETPVVQRRYRFAAEEAGLSSNEGRGGGGRLWADLMRRTFGFDVLACPRCGGRMRLIATIEQAEVVQRVLHHLGLSTDLPAPRPARAPPLPEDALSGDFGVDLVVFEPGA